MDRQIAEKALQAGGFALPGRAHVAALVRNEIHEFKDVHRRNSLDECEVDILNGDFLERRVGRNQAAETLHKAKKRAQIHTVFVHGFLRAALDVSVV